MLSRSARARTERRYSATRACVRALACLVEDVLHGGRADGRAVRMRERGTQTAQLLFPRQRLPGAQILLGRGGRGDYAIQRVDLVGHSKHNNTKRTPLRDCGTRSAHRRFCWRVRSGAIRSCAGGGNRQPRDAMVAAHGHTLRCHRRSVHRGGLPRAGPARAQCRAVGGDLRSALGPGAGAQRLGPRTPSSRATLPSWRRRGRPRCWCRSCCAPP